MMYGGRKCASLPSTCDATDPRSGIGTTLPGCAPESMYCVPSPCPLAPAFGWYIDRTTASLSTTRAVSLSSSVNRIPGTLVLIGLYGLRCSTTASGFGSHVSICDSPPCSRITSTLFAGARLFAAKVGRRPASETRPLTPNLKKLRREQLGCGKRIGTLESEKRVGCVGRNV